MCFIYIIHIYIYLCLYFIVSAVGVVACGVRRVSCTGMARVVYWPRLTHLGPLAVGLGGLLYNTNTR